MKKDIETISDKLAGIAVKSMIYELTTSPKPGLVDAINPGSHKDMDKYTFIDSSLVLYPYFRSFANLAFYEEDLEILFKELRRQGAKAEKAMFRATAGVNTQKGLIFILGLITASSAYIIRRDQSWDLESMIYIVQDMTQGLVDRELKNLDEKNITSSGEKLYKKYGVKGIRGEVEAGFPTVRNYGLKTLETSLEDDLSLNDAFLNTLFSLMSKSEDTNVIWRTGREGLDYMRARSEEFLSKGGMKSKGSMEALRHMDMEFIKRNISPGGSADLLATTIMMYLLNEEFK